MNFGIRKYSRHRGHCVLVTEISKRNSKYSVGYMCAGATWGELAVKTKHLEFVPFTMWLILLCMTGWKYKQYEI